MKKRWKRRQIKGSGGTTLVELVVAMLLLGIIMTMIVGILSPAAKLFLRMERLQRAQVILDNVILELQGIADNATGYVKIYPQGQQSPVGATGAGAGGMLEFINPDNYVTLVSAEGCQATDILAGGAKIDSVGAVDSGRLLARYYTRDVASQTYQYTDAAGSPAARAVAAVFADDYYIGNYLEVTFSYPADVLSEGDRVAALEADVKLYSDKEKSNLVVQESVLLYLRYAVVRKDKVTAGDAVTPP